jgi:hypothetical protein
VTDFTIEMGTRMRELLTRFKLPTCATEMARRFTEGGHDDALPTLLEVLEAEADERGQRRTARLLKTSRLPPGKTLETLDRTRIPRSVGLKLDELATGAFLDRAHNVLCFGLPGRGKTHAAAALGHALVRHGHQVLFAPTFRLVQELLAAKRDLALPRALQRLVEILTAERLYRDLREAYAVNATLARLEAAVRDPVARAAVLRAFGWGDRRKLEIVEIRPYPAHRITPRRWGEVHAPPRDQAPSDRSMRNNQSFSRKPRSASSGRKRPGLSPEGRVRAMAFSLRRKSACT